VPNAIITYTPVKQKTVTVHLPASKSISNRLLIIKALSGYLENIHNLSTADDTQTLLEILQKVNRKEHNARLGGTTFRFLLAYLALLRNEFILTAEGKLLERPVKKLVDGLNKLGADIAFLHPNNQPPLLIRRGNMRGGKITIDASQSSQFVSALMLIAPYLQGGLHIDLQGEIVSKPYVEMTAQLMREFGAEVTVRFPGITIQEGRYARKTYFVENDWSAASYFYQFFLFSEKLQQLKLPYLYATSLQGDREISTIYAQLGIQTVFHDDAVVLQKQANYALPDFFVYDFSACPDLAQTLAVTCALLKIPAKLTGLQTLPLKETNRLQALQQELAKIGVAAVQENNQTLLLNPENLHAPTDVINTYDDHRMAMAFSVLAMVFKRVQMETPAVVSKSFPLFWEEARKLGVEMLN
jgi:3-phosphoshikimate 1-carboxyvinyltransferase